MTEISPADPDEHLGLPGWPYSTPAPLPRAGTGPRLLQSGGLPCERQRVASHTQFRQYPNDVLNQTDIAMKHRVPVFVLTVRFWEFPFSSPLALVHVFVETAEH